MRILSFLLITFTVLTLNAQDISGNWLSQPSESEFNLGKKIEEPGNIEGLNQFVYRHAGLGKNSEMLLISRKSSKMGSHFTFKQVVEGKEVYGGIAKLNVNKYGEVLSFFNHTFRAGNFDLEFPQLNDELIQEMQSGTLDCHEMRSSEIWFVQNDKLIPAIRMNCITGNEGLIEELVYDINGNLLHQEQKSRAFAIIDTIGKGKVFLPDPITSSRSKYGELFKDNNDADAVILNDQRVEVEFILADPVDDTFQLKGPYAQSANKQSPFNKLAKSTSNYFDYTRSQAEFEELNTYYHITNFQTYIREQLDIKNLANYSLEFDPHALNGQDQSVFMPHSNDSTGYLLFGEGGVDDAEDADVIVHEYCHAIAASASPATYAGGEEAKGLEEGICDYFACSYSRHYDPYEWQKLFNWDGHNPFWEDGRVCGNKGKYPQDLGRNRYTMGEIWSGSMMEIWGYIGREETDKLMLTALYSFGPNMKFTDAALLVQQADSALNNKRHYGPINTVFKRRNLLNNVSTGLEEEKSAISMNWNSPDQKIHLNYLQADKAYTLKLTSIDGKGIEVKNISGASSFEYDLSGLHSGFYLASLYRDGTELKWQKVVIP